MKLLLTKWNVRCTAASWSRARPLEVGRFNWHLETMVGRPYLSQFYLAAVYSCGEKSAEGPVPSYVTDRKSWARFRNDAHAVRPVLALCQHWLRTLRKYQFANEGCIKWKRYVCTSTEERSRLKASVSLLVLKQVCGLDTRLPLPRIHHHRQEIVPRFRVRERTA